MPKVDIPGPHRFHFFSDESAEPPHVHLRRDYAICKFWLAPVSVSQNRGFSVPELNEIKRLIEENRLKIETAWHEHFQDID
jgi:hypothetical protein